MIELIMLLGLASLSIEISDSTLSNKVKRLLYLDKEYSVINTLSSFQFYQKILPFYYLTFLIFPIIFLITIFNVFKIIQELLSCPFCISFWLGSSFSYLIMNGDILTSIIYGGVTIIFTRIIDKYLIEW